MQIHNVRQGSPEWLALRKDYHTASEAPIMLGKSKHKKRDELLAADKCGIEKEISNFVQENLLDKGHAVEAAIRPYIESIIGEELYPVTGSKTIDGVPLLASFDGLTMLREINFEHKLWNEILAEQVRNNQLDQEYTIQLDQQHMVSSCEKTIFVVSDGTPEKCVYMWYHGDKEQQAAVLAGWKQYEKDLEIFEYIPPEPKAIAGAIMELPTLSVQVSGKIENSNLTQFQASAVDLLKNVNFDLQTDDDFANAEAMVKYCDKTEKQLEIVKNQALSQTADIEKFFSTVNFIKDEFKATRLKLDKLVKSQKETIKTGIFNDGRKTLTDHIEALNKSLGGEYVSYIADLKGAMKNKRTLASLRDAVNTEIANAKIKANAEAEKVRANLRTLEADATEYRFLFNDLSAIVKHENDYFTLIVKQRVEDHKKSEAAKLEAEREKIRLEEAAKLEADNRAKLDAATAIAQKSDAQVDREQAREAADLIETILDADVVGVETSNVKTIKAVSRPLPDAEEIVDVLADHYHITRVTVISWLSGMDFTAVQKKLSTK